MLRNELKTFRLLKTIYQKFPEVEIIRPDGSRKKLSEIFSRAPEKKSTTEIFFQSTQRFEQLSFDFGNNGGHNEKGGT
jgi:hypothetical protein